MTEFAATSRAVAAFVGRVNPDRVYIRPLGFSSGAEAVAAVTAGRGTWLTGGALAFDLCALTARNADDCASIVAPVAAIAEWCRDANDAPAQSAAKILTALTAPREAFARLPLVTGRGRETILMGIVNVTPDSFSDGGRWLDPDAAIAHGTALHEAGAQILDVGGESTRPGAAPITVDEELRRVLPVVRGLAETGAVVSIDTRNAAVMDAALDEGAHIVNDVTALSGDPASLAVAAKAKAPVILMHMQGTPETMQDNPSYENAPLDVYDYLADRIEACENAGIARARIVVDPGIGFGKTKHHNAEILNRIALFHGLGCGILLGVSRKGFVAGAAGSVPPDKRLPGSLAAALHAVEQGVQILRVHDVAETRQALAVWDAVRGATP